MKMNTLKIKLGDYFQCHLQIYMIDYVSEILQIMNNSHLSNIIMIYKKLYR